MANAKNEAKPSISGNATNVLVLIDGFPSFMTP
jgi:hypothetical protein